MSKNYGNVIHDGTVYVIREKIVGNKVQLFVHRKVDGVEHRPRGYMAGSNYLEFDLATEEGT